MVKIRRRQQKFTNLRKTRMCLVSCRPKWSRLHKYTRRLPDDLTAKRRCCPVDGNISPDDWIWKDDGPHCPKCNKKLVEVKPCSTHESISCNKISWEDDKPYCPECHEKLC